MARKLTHREEVELAKLRLRAAALPDAGAPQTAGLPAGATQLLGGVLGTRLGRVAGSALLGLGATLLVRSPVLRSEVLAAFVRNRLLR